MTRVTVGTADLRRALLSVAPHADPDDEFPPLHRVRLDVGPVNLTATATNRYTAGHALVSVGDGDGTGEMSAFDLSPTDVKEILALFRASSKDDEQPDDMLRLDVDDALVSVTDVSGLFDGKALSLPRYPDEPNFPDVLGLISTSLRRERTDAERLVTSGRLVKLFTAAARAYAEPLVIEPTGESSTLVISCGESFIGLLMPMRQDDDTDARQNEWRQAWLRRLPAPATVTAS